MESRIESREREILTEFLSLYLDLPCLWDIGSDLYKDRNQKTQAWGRLMEKLKEVEPEANIASTKKKIENIRSAFKREYKKVKESKRTGAGANDVHVPNLWYYNLLLPIFEKKDDQSRCGMDTLTSDEESGSSQHEKGRKRRGDILEKKKEALIDTAQGLLLSDDRKESHKKINSFGLYVGEQLDQVETFQRQVAEKLISDVLFLAKTGNLNFESRVETTTRSRNVTFSRSSSSNISYMPQAPSYHNMIHASPSPHHYQTFPSPHFINQPSLSPRSTYSSPSPQTQHIQPAPSPHQIQPSPSPHQIQPSSSPHQIQPSPSPHQIQPSPSPQTQHIQPSSSPHHILKSSQHSQPSSSHHFQTLSQHMQAPPPPQNSLLFTTLQAQLPTNDENEYINQISIPSPNSISNDTNTIIYEGPASGITDFLIFKKGK